MGVFIDWKLVLLAVPTSMTGVARARDGIGTSSWTGVLGWELGGDFSTGGVVCGLLCGFRSGAIDVASESVVSSVKVDGGCDAVETVRR